MIIKLAATILIATLCNITSAHAESSPEQPPSSDQNSVSITIYRARGFVGSLVSYPVTINGVRVAKLKPGMYTSVSVDPGVYTVCVFGTRFCVDPKTLVAGASYFVRNSTGSDGGAFYAALDVAEHDEAVTEFADFKFKEPLQPFIAHRFSNEIQAP
jgi:hypothetical protein